VGRAYEAPVLRDLGSLKDLTAQQFNKVGKKPDIYTVETNDIVIGSLVPVA